MAFTQICCDVPYLVLIIAHIWVHFGNTKIQKIQKLLEINLKIVHWNKIELALA
jgi:hypothetical protein